MVRLGGLCVALQCDLKSGEEEVALPSTDATKQTLLESEEHITATAVDHKRDEESIPHPSQEPSEAALAGEHLIPDGHITTFARLLDLYRRDDWKPAKGAEGCEVYSCAVDYCDKSAVRLVTTIRCSLLTFQELLADETKVRIYDPNLQDFQILNESPQGVVIYTSYKQQSRFITPRDFCSVTARHLLTPDGALRHNIVEKRAPSSQPYVLIQSSVSIPGGKPSPKTHLRGVVHSFGYVAFGDRPEKIGIRVENVMCVDPGGQIPKMLLDAAQGESCKKLAVIRSLCEQLEVAKAK
jgi:hypothetical protein